MIGAIWHKELTEYRRDRRALALAIVLFALLLAAALDGWNRAAADAQTRAAAQATDREVWTEQGENNPHGAAHFSRYAFRDTPTLAAFDPGVFDYAGAAFWMEAHTQNPTTLRRQREMFVVEGLRRVFVQPAEHPRPAPALSLLVAVVGTNKLQLVEAELWRGGAAPRQRRQPEQQQA